MFVPWNIFMPSIIGCLFRVLDVYAECWGTDRCECPLALRLLVELMEGEQRHHHHHCDVNPHHDHHHHHGRHHHHHYGSLWNWWRTADISSSPIANIIIIITANVITIIIVELMEGERRHHHRQSSSWASSSLSCPTSSSSSSSETSAFRNEDRLNRRIIFLETNTNGNQLNANVPRRKKIWNIKPFFAQKRQILITAAFQIPNEHFTKNGNLELTNIYDKEKM